ncbi:MAG: Transposase, family, partial [Planctomycetaceae bacterium]|nr:Transposase, family [Planctomycetaceae bacterium]
MTQNLFNEVEIAAAKPSEGQPIPVEVGGIPRLRIPVRDQKVFTVESLDDQLAFDHEARAVWVFVCKLDLSALIMRVKSVEGQAGRDANDPRLLLSLWIYATLRGVDSARELHILCDESRPYRWLCGGVSMNYHSLASFRSENGAVLRDLRIQVVAILMHAGLVTLDVVAQDGMKVRASAGKSSFRREASLEECLAAARAQVETLETTPAPELDKRRQAAQARAAREKVERVTAALKNLEKLTQQKEAKKNGTGNTARASTTDPDAHVVKFSDGGYRPGYNVQFAIDSGSGVIVGVHVTNAGNDFGQMSPMLRQIEDSTGQPVKALAVDCGYSTPDDIEAVEVEHGTTLYIPIKDRARKEKKGLDIYARLKVDTDATAACRARMATPEAQEIYKLRGQTAELINAQARNRNFWFMPVRGLIKTAAVAELFALAHNIDRAVKLLFTLQAKLAPKIC